MTNINESHIHGMEQKKAYCNITRKNFDLVEKEIIAADVEYDDIDEALAQVNKQLESYTFDGDNVDYAIAIMLSIKLNAYPFFKLNTMTRQRKGALQSSYSMSLRQIKLGRSV